MTFDGAVGEIVANGIFMPFEVYQRTPLTLPWVVRDLSCRGGSNGARGSREQWGSADADGYMRDDNSMIKGLKRGMTSSRTGLAVGTGYTAAHVWRVVKHEMLASRLPLLYSFVPNVVWLPKITARATDIEGGPYQQALQAVAWAVYRNVEVPEPRAGIAAAAWQLIPEPPAHVVVDPAALTWFVQGSRGHESVIRRIREVVAALEQLDAGASLPRRVVCSRYATGLPAVEQARRDALLHHLRRFL